MRFPPLGVTISQFTPIRGKVSEQNQPKIEYKEVCKILEAPHKGTYQAIENVNFDDILHWYSDNGYRLVQQFRCAKK